MKFKSIDVATSVGGNLITEVDNTVAKSILTAEELVVKNNVSLLVAGLSVATNVAIGLIPEEWTLATQVVGKLDMADMVEYADRGADIVLAGSVVSLGMSAKAIYSDLAKIDKMTSAELKIFLENRTKERYTHETVKAIETIETVEEQKA